MKTRGRSSNKPKEESKEIEVSVNPKAQLGTDEANPPHLILLPKDITKNARIITLQDPRYLAQSRYLICPEKGIYELKKLAAPKPTPRSWLLSQDEFQPKNEVSNESKERKEGFVMRNADLMIATLVDPLFIILPYLAPTSSKAAESSKKLFLSRDDYFDKMITSSPDLGTVLRSSPQLRSLLERRIAPVCDTVEAGDETMYRFNEGKLLEELLKKAKRMAEKGLPPSVEENLVRKALEVPMLSIVEESTSQGSAKGEDQDISFNTTLAIDTVDAPDAQSIVASVDTAASSFSEASTVATSFSERSTAISETPKLNALPMNNAPDGITNLLRLRTALFFILSSYVAPQMSVSLKQQLSSTTTIDFAPLDSHLSYLAKLRQEALAARSLGDYSRKRVLDEEETEMRAEKRRKEEDEKKRKANESRGVKALKKVNINGMKKMSDFFKKK